MPQIEIVDSGVIYINSNPGYEYYFACHSHLVELGPQELFCGFQRGQALYSVDSQLLQARSTDGGRNWKTEGLMIDPAGDDGVYSYHGPMLTRLPDGTLIANDGQISKQAFEVSIAQNGLVLEATVTYGMPPFTFLWNSGEITQNINPANWGNTYYVFAEDAFGCIDSSNTLIALGESTIPNKKMTLSQ